MNATSLLIGLLVGLPLGGIAAWLIAGRRNDAGQSEAVSQAVNEAIIALRDDAEAGRQAAIDQLNQINATAHESQVKLQEERAKREREAVKNLVDPVEEHLKEVSKRVETLTKDSGENKVRITEMVQSLHQKSDRLADVTTSLSQAMRSPGAKGGWGEKQLESLVEAAGMRAHLRNYRTQVATDAEGDSSRPDMAIAMPGELEMLIDSKVPLENLLKAFETEDLDERERYLDAHADALRTQVINLAKKEYPKKVNNSLDFVVLFVPGDHFLDLALSRRPQLLEEALERHVILTSPSSFFAVLLAVSTTWQQHQLAENAEAIANEGKELYGRLRILINHTSSVGKALNKAVESFNQMIGSFDTRLIPSARRMESLGATDGKSIDLPDPIDVIPRESQKVEELPAPEDDAG
jgi:DNA recombination protein RmuC